MQTDNRAPGILYYITQRERLLEKIELLSLVIPRIDCSNPQWYFFYLELLDKKKELSEINKEIAIINNSTDGR